MWQCARHLDWCYSDIPVFLPLQIAATTAWLGHTSFGIRFGSLLYSILIAALLFHWGRRAWRDAGIGAAAGVLFLLSPFGSIAAVYTATDVPLAFWWLLASYALWIAVRSDRRGSWGAVGLFLLFGCLSKYLMIFWVAGAAVFLLWDPAGRRWLRRPEPYLALAIGGLSAVPFLYWNFQHDWVALTFQVQDRHRAQIGVQHLGGLLGGQLLVLSPLLLVVLGLALMDAGHRLRSDPERATTLRLLLCFTLVTPVILFFISLLTRVSPFWPAVGYPAAMLLVAGWAGTRSGDGRLRRGRVALTAAAAALSLLVVAFLHFSALHPDVAFGLFGRRLDKAGRPTKISQRQLKDFYGWEELAARVSARMREANARHPTFILSPQSTVASFLAFYTDRQYDTYLYRETGPDGTVFGETSPNVMGYLFWQDLANRRGDDALFVTARPDRVAAMPIARHFDAWTLVEEVPVVHRGRELRRFHIYAGRGFKGWPPPDP
jgi:hypothetical protein